MNNDTIWIIPANISALVIEDGRIWQGMAPLVKPTRLPKCFVVRMNNGDKFPISEKIFHSLHELMDASKRYMLNEMEQYEGVWRLYTPVEIMSKPVIEPKK